jgi:hypothetical protein
MTSCFNRDGRVEEPGGDGVLQPPGGQRQRTEQGVPEGGGPAPQLFRHRAGQVIPEADQGVPEGGGPAPQLFRHRAGQVNRKETCRRRLAASGTGSFDMFLVQIFG